MLILCVLHHACWRSYSMEKVLTARRNPRDLFAMWRTKEAALDSRRRAVGGIRCGGWILVRSLCFPQFDFPMRKSQ